MYRQTGGRAGGVVTTRGNPNSRVPHSPIARASLRGRARPVQCCGPGWFVAATLHNVTGGSTVAGEGRGAGWGRSSHQVCSGPASTHRPGSKEPLIMAGWRPASCSLASNSGGGMLCEIAGRVSRAGARTRKRSRLLSVAGSTRCSIETTNDTKRGSEPN